MEQGKLSRDLLHFERLWGKDTMVEHLLPQLQKFIRHGELGLSKTLLDVAVLARCGYLYSIIPTDLPVWHGMTPDDIDRCRQYKPFLHDILGYVVEQLSDDMTSGVHVLRSWLQTKDPKNPVISRLFLSRLDHVLMPNVSRFIARCVTKCRAANQYYDSLQDKKVQAKLKKSKEECVLLEECVVCMDDVPCVTFKPCNHKVTCDICAQIVLDKFGECPYCRSDIKDMV